MSAPVHPWHEPRPTASQGTNHRPMPANIAWSTERIHDDLGLHPRLRSFFLLWHFLTLWRQHWFRFHDDSKLDICFDGKSKNFAKLRQGRPRWGRFGRTTKYQLFEQVDRSRAGRGSTCTEWWWRRRRRSSTFWLRSRSSILSTAPVPLLSGAVCMMSALTKMAWLSCWTSLCAGIWLSRPDSTENACPHT